MKKRCAQKSMQTGLGTNYESKNISGETGPVKSWRHLRRKSIWAGVEKPKRDYSHGRSACKVESTVCRRVQKGFLLAESCVMRRDSQMSMIWWVFVESTQEDRKGLVHF